MITVLSLIIALFVCIILLYYRTIRKSETFSLAGTVSFQVTSKEDLTWAKDICDVWVDNLLYGEMTMANSDKDAKWEGMIPVAQSNKLKYELQHLHYKLKGIDPRITKVYSGFDAAQHAWKLRLKFNDGFILDYHIFSEVLENESTDQLWSKVTSDCKALITEKHPLPKPTIIGGVPSIQGGAGIKKSDFVMMEELLSQDEKVAYSAAKKAMFEQLYSAPISYKEMGTILGGSSTGKTSFVAPPPTTPPVDPEKVWAKLANEDYFDSLNFMYGKLAQIAGTKHPDLYGPLAAKAAQAKATAHKKYQAKLLQATAYGPHQHGFSGQVVQDSLRQVLPCLYERVKCPAKSCGSSMVMSECIIHLNDEHDWTREAIADWAEALEIDTSVKGEEDNVERR